MKKGAPRIKNQRPVRPVKPASGGDDLFIPGVDDEFRRSLMNLRNSIDSEFKERDSRVVMFTSAVKGEGKTLIASYLARVLAQSEADRVLIIDCAINDPKIHELFGIENEKGIIDYLSGDVTLEEIIRPVDDGVLDIITSGSVRMPDVTQPLFKSALMDELIAETGARYDYVIIDTSAVLEAPETPVIGSRANGIALVIQAGHTKREVVQRAIMMVRKLDGHFLGSILNRKKYYIPEFIYRRV